MNPIKILGIAPYKGMKTIMANIAANRSDVDLTVYVGDLGEGADIVQRVSGDNYDVIISRGGTAQLIGQLVTVPVIEVPLSVYDILRAIKLAENCSDTYAIVGFPNITENAKLLCSLLQYDISILTINSMEDAKVHLNALRKQGCRIVICDVVTNSLAKKLGLTPILITSGTESIESAFNQAVKLCTSYSVIKSENRFLKAIIENEPGNTLVYSSNKCLQYESSPSDDSAKLHKVIDKEWEGSLESGVRKIMKSHGDTLLDITSKKITLDNHDFLAFYTKKAPAKSQGARTGIHYLNKTDVIDSFFNNCYDITSGSLKTLIGQFYKHRAPLLISGEQGTGKEQLAGSIYAQSSHQNNPFTIIDCRLMNDKSWNHLTSSPDSPLFSTGSTLFIRDIGALSEQRAWQLFSLAKDLNLYRNNLLIFSYINEESGQNEHPIFQHLLGQLHCLHIPLIPLRMQAEEIPRLASLYINTLNMELAREIIGFEPKALQLLENFGWPNNFIQFKRILQGIVDRTHTPYISTDTVEEILGGESPLPPAGSKKQDADFFLSHTLEEINKEVALMVLKDCDGNQSVAAQRLGISRTTLWRMLK